MERHDGQNVAREARFDDRSIVVERVGRERAVPWLDASPLDRESKGVEAQVLDEVEVFFVAMPRIAGVTARLYGACAGRTLVSIPVVVRVAAFNLVRRSSRAPEKLLGQ